MAYSIERMPERISIGRETETGVTDVMIDCGAWVSKWPGMALHAIYTPEGGAPYILQTETDGGVLVWHVTDADTAKPGTGLVEIVGETDGRRKVSAMVKVSVAARMSGTVGEPPEAAKPWADRVVEAAERITGMKVHAETLDAGSSATAAWDGEQGLLTIGVPKGEQGPKGENGEKGPQGEKGEPGKDAVVDATLTQSGQAAEAKATGDVVSQLKDDLTTKVDFETFEDISEPIGHKTISLDILSDGKMPYLGYYDMYSDYLEVLPSTTYRLSFTDGYSGSGNAARLCYVLYDADKNIIKSVPETLPTSATTGEAVSFRRSDTGANNGYDLKSSLYPNGGFTNIETTEDSAFIRFYIFIHSQQGLSRDPSGWSMTYEKQVPKYSVKNDAIQMDPLFKSLAKFGDVYSKNLFVMENASIQTIVFLGYNASGIAQYGWYFDTYGHAASSVSGRGLDSISDFIKVSGGSIYRKPSKTILTILDSTYKVIGSIGYGENKCTIPDNGVYVRIGFDSTEFESIQFTSGENEQDFDKGRLSIPGYSGNDVYNTYLVEKRNGLPWGYSREYALSVANEANKYTAHNRHTFAWISDTHTHPQTTHIGGLVADLTKYVHCNFVAHTGDIIDGFEAPEKELSILTELNRYMTESKCSILYCKGNHDDDCIYSRGSTTGQKRGLDTYILNNDLYCRTNSFAKDVTFGSRQNMYFYHDDDNTKIRSIFLNAFDNPETETDGVRDEDARTSRISDEQYAWIVNSALNLKDKDTPSDWGVTMYAHLIGSELSYLWNLINAFATGGSYNRHGIDADFSGQGALEFIAMFTGDAHFDAVSKKTVGDNVYTNLAILNASLAQDNVGAASTTNKTLYPPTKRFGTENETAFDIVTIDRAEKKIYLTRYGARSYAYNAETEQFDIVVDRTRIVNYQTGEYDHLIS